MSTNVNSVVKHFPSPQNGFTTTTSGSVSSGATTVGLASVAGFSNGQVAVFVIDPTDPSKKQTFTGTVDTSGVQLTDVKWTAGTNQTHALGATVVDYATATHIAMMSKGMLVEHDQDGTHTNITATSITTDTLTINNATTTAGYNPLGAAPNTVTYNGNRSYDLVFNGTDYTDRLSPGMRLQTTRTVAAPTQCTSLNGTTQYWVKTSPSGLTFTDDFVVSAWVKLTTYQFATVASRYNGTSGWSFYANASGQIVLQGFNGGAANYSQVVSYQSIPLNKWVHVAAQLDMSTFTATTTTSYVMIDGVDVPASVSRSGTNPTALVQAGNLEIGSSNGGGSDWAGKIAQVAIYNAKVTQANIKATISQGLSGSETSLASAYSFNNSTNDLTATANNLSAGAGSPTSTNADSPFGGQADGTISTTLDYAIIQKASFSTNTTLTVQVPEGCTIPTTGGVSAVSYSTQKAPYGMPVQVDKWYLEMLCFSDLEQNSPTASTWYNPGSLQLNIPVGAWRAYYSAFFYGYKAGSNAFAMKGTLSTANNTEAHKDFTVYSGGALSPTNTEVQQTINKEKQLTLSSATPYYINVQTGTAASNAVGTRGDIIPTIVRAENSYL